MSRRSKIYQETAITHCIIAYNRFSVMLIVNGRQGVWCAGCLSDAVLHLVFFILKIAKFEKFIIVNYRYISYTYIADEYLISIVGWLTVILMCYNN